MKKLCIFVIISVLVAALICCPIALAETAPSSGEGVQQSNESFAAYFEREWLDKIAQYICVFLGAVSAVAVTVSKVKKAHAALVADSRHLADSQHSLADTQRALAEAKEAYTSAADEVQNALGLVYASQKEISARFADSEATLERLKRAVTVGLCNNPELVQEGYAKEIAAILGVQHEEKHD